MNKFKILGKFLLVCLCFSLFSTSSVQAQVTTFTDLNLELTIPNEVIYLTPDTLSGDPLWAKAGITDVSSEKKELSDMGGLAVFYDSETDTLVRLLSKTSSDSKEIFNLNQQTEEQRQEFYNSMTSGSDESATFTIEEYPHTEIPFFRLSIHMNDSNSSQELIYGTIVNGTMIYFDVYSDNQNATIDESLLQSLVAGTHFTKQYTQEEYETLRNQSIMRVIVYLLILVAVIVILAVITKQRNKKKALLKKKKSDALHQYYANKKEKEALGIQQTQLFENHTTYSEQVIRQFCNYTHYLKKLPVWVITGILYILLIGLLYLQTGLSTKLLILIGIMIGTLAFHYFRVDKLVHFLWKPYADRPNKVADFHFYEDHFTMTGIQYLTDYPYFQITSISEHDHYIYLYFGTERAVYLDKDGFNTSSDEFLTFIKGYLKSVDDTKVEKRK